MKVKFLHTRLSLRTRFVIALFFYAAAALLQMPGWGSFSAITFRFAALGLLVIPLWFLKAGSFSNKPPVNKPPAGKAQAGKTAAGKKADGGKQTGTWRTVTMTELDRLRNRIGTIQKIKIPLFYYPALGILMTIVSITLLVFAGIFTGAAGFFVILNLYLGFFPFMWFAQIEKWVPAISAKLDSFAPVLEARLPEKLRISPMLFFDGDGADQVPGDIRLMLAPEPGDELLGAQFQISYNNGPNGAVPYVYAVFITKGKGKMWQSLKDLRAARYLTEPGSSTEGDTLYGTVVLRQDTNSRSDGYHTNEKDVRELFGLVSGALEKLV